MPSSKTKLDFLAKTYVDALSENERNRRDRSIVFNDQDYDVDNLKLTISDSITVNRNPTLDEELSNKMYADDD